MTETWYPNPAVTQLQHERLLGRAMPSGLLGVPSDQPLVFADGGGTREVRIRASRQGVVQGFGWQNDASVFTLPSLAVNSSGSTRVDLVVLRLDRTDWSVRVKVVQGTPGAGTPAPITNPPGGSPDYFDVPLAAVTVANGATSLASNTVAQKAWYLNADGDILCTKDTSPPHERGRRKFETDTGRAFISTGTSWLITAEDSGAAVLTMTGGSAPWVASQNGVWRRNGWVSMQLTARRPLAAMFGDTSYVVATVPTGFRPPAAYGAIQTTAVVPSSNGTAAVSISPAGAVSVSPAVGINSDRSFIISSVGWPADL